MDQAIDEAGYLEAEQKLFGIWDRDADGEAESGSARATMLVNRDWYNYHLHYLRARAFEQGLSARDYYISLVRSHEASEQLFAAVQGGRLLPQSLVVTGRTVGQSRKISFGKYREGELDNFPLTA